MSIQTSLITGLSIGVEYVQADEEAGIECSCILIDLLVFRLVVELTGE